MADKSAGSVGPRHALSKYSAATGPHALRRAMRMPVKQDVRLLQSVREHQGFVAQHPAGFAIRHHHPAIQHDGAGQISTTISRSCVAMSFVPGICRINA